MFKPVIVLGQVGDNAELVRHLILHHILHSIRKVSFDSPLSKLRFVFNDLC